MTSVYSVNQLQQMIAPIAKRFGVKRVYAFGSYARNEATYKSDLDLCIEKGAIRSLFELADFRLTLEETLAIPVDVVTTDIRDKKFLDVISDDEVLLYDAQ